MRYFTIFLLLISFSVQGQTIDNNLVNGTFNNLTIDQFAAKIESVTKYHFYYDISELDSLRLNFSVENKPIDETLKIAFQNSEFKFAISGFDVFLTKNKTLITQLPLDLFGEMTSLKDSLAKQELASNFTEEAENKAPNATLENKLYIIGAKTTNLSGNAILSGVVRDVKTGEPIIGAAVYVENPRIGVTTDQFGYYSITIPKGKHVLNIKDMGMRDRKHQIILYANGKLNIELQEQVFALKEVVVSAEKAANVSRAQMGVEKLTIKSIKQMPAVFGEADIMKAVLTLPGVKSVGEASSGFNVRGGSTDQNLILFNDATIYNPSHFFGFFSAFNPEVVKDVELYKSSIPAKFGGRLSSVLDISTRDGNKKKFSGSAGIGLLTSRLNVEGPLIKDRTSFILGGRTTYSNWLLGLLPGQYSKSRASFYDFNLGITHQLDDKNSIYISGYLSNDQFSLNKDTSSFAYNNRNGSVKWRHVFNNKFNGVFTVGKDSYTYKVSGNEIPSTAYKLNFDINQSNFKSDFTYYLNSKHSLDFGFNSIYYKLHPGNFKPLSKLSLIAPDELSAQ